MADDDYPSTERSHVLVLGTRGSSCCPEQFVRRLLSLQEPDGTESKQEGPPFHWTLTTKYYRAELALHVRHAEPGAAASAAVSLEEGPHGVIVVVDGQQAAGLEAWRSWLGAVAELGPELCICVGMVPPLEEEGGDEEAREELVRERALWCLESGFEYVQVDAIDRGATQQRRRLPSELRETEGLARVRESIEATPWPTLVRLPRGGSSSSQDRDGDAAGGDRKNTAASVGKSVEAAAVDCERSAGKGGGEGGQQPSREATAAEALSLPTAAAAASSGASEWAGTNEEDLEDLFDRIRAIRESARQGQGAGAGNVAGASAGMPDEERRARAAGAALELAKLLGLGDEEDSDVELGR